MGSLHSLEDRALAQLRARLGAVEEANQDLIAFARGHHGAVGSIHRAVLRAMRSANLGELNHIVTGEWPDILSIDHCVLALADGDTGSLATASRIVPLDRAMLARAVRGLPPVSVRDVPRGNALFGEHCAAIRAEALIRIDFAAGDCVGLLLLGQDHSPGLGECGGNELLRFLGQSLGAMIERWRGQAIS